METLKLMFYPIENSQDRFKVIAEGAAHQEPLLPFPENEINPRSTLVRILDSIKFNRNNFSEAEIAWMVREKLSNNDAFLPDYLQQIGSKLYATLGQNIQQIVETKIAVTKRDRNWLHIQLEFPVDDHKYVHLTDYPWELFCNNYGFLAHQGVAFSRYLAYPRLCPNLPSHDRVEVLLISAKVGDQRMGFPPLSSSEQEAIALGLQNAQESIQLKTLANPTFLALRQHLLANPLPQVLHFDCHGFFGKRCHQQECRTAHKQKANQCEKCGTLLGEPQGYLLLENSHGAADYISAKEIGELVGNQPIGLVVLSSCRSGMSRLSESVFNGVAQNLIGQGIPAVVAMTYTIEVSAAQAFVETFYRSLGKKDPLAIALRHGQSAMGIEGNQWYRPILYLRWEDNQGGQLFNLPIAEPVRDRIASDRSKLSNMNQSASRKLDLEEELTDLLEEKEACKNQIRSTIDDAQKTVLKRKLDKLNRQIAELESQL